MSHDCGPDGPCGPCDRDSEDRADAQAERDAERLERDREPRGER